MSVTRERRRVDDATNNRTGASFHGNDYGLEYSARGGTISWKYLHAEDHAIHLDGSSGLPYVSQPGYVVSTAVFFGRPIL